MAKTCQICNKPSGMYPLCPACFKLRDAGEVLKCEECKTWHKKNEPCQCEKIEQPIKEEPIEKQEEPAKTSEKSKRKCLLCKMMPVIIISALLVIKSTKTTTLS